MNVPFTLQMLLAAVVMALSLHFVESGRGRRGSKHLKLVWKINKLQA